MSLVTQQFYLQCNQTAENKQEMFTLDINESKTEIRENNNGLNTI